MKRKSVFALLLVVTMLATCFVMQAASVSAAGEGEKIAYAEKESTEVIADFTDMTKVTGTWDNGIERKFDGNKLIISNDVSGNINGLIVTGVEPGTYKVGYFYDIKAIKDAEDAPEDISGMQDWRMRLNPYGTYLNLPYYPCTFDNIEFEGLSTVVTDDNASNKIIAIAVIEVLEDGDIELLSHVSNMAVTVDDETYSNFIDGTLDRIVFAGADYDFGPANYPDYEIFIEQEPHEGDEERKAYEDDWTESNTEIPSTAEPTEPTAEPTAEPTVEPTEEPTVEPTEEPTATPEATEAPATTAPAASATATPADGDSEGGINPAIIVVIVVVVVAIIAVVVVVMKKKK